MELPFIARHLSAGERLAEILFGLIMTLSFTLTAGIVVGPAEEGAVRKLLLATFGCNIAWGIIDGALLILGRVFDRGRYARIGQAIRRAPAEDEAIDTVAGELDETLGPLTTLEQRRHLYRQIVARVRSSPHRSPGLRGEDLMAASAVFLLVFSTSFPAALPFLFIREPWVALRVSNALLIGLLFLIGYNWAGYTSINRWRAAGVLTLFGMLMVGVSILLGG